jgi:hypothetical protein
VPPSEPDAEAQAHKIRRMRRTSEGLWFAECRCGHLAEPGKHRGQARDNHANHELSARMAR